jgi:hypothetical protein
VNVRGEYYIEYFTNNCEGKDSIKCAWKGWIRYRVLYKKLFGEQAVWNVNGRGE